MEAESLKSAGDYLNNILLARGRLPQGKNIDFVQLAAPKTEKQRSENVNATIRVINLIHSLVLNADAQDEHNESVALTLRELKADLSRCREENERLERGKLEDDRKSRQLAQENATVQAQVQQATAAMRRSRDELVRVKTTLEQVRTQCAADIRRRDVQIEKLKTHLATQQRGVRGAPVAPSIAITPGHIGTGQRVPSQSQHLEGPNLADAEYNLAQESTQFLTQLCQDLSNENDLLLGTLKRSTEALRRTLQMPKQPQPAPDGATSAGDAQVQILTTSHDSLRLDLDALVESATAILTNPSFIAIEEVEEGYHIRDQEIENLREGWLKMEQRLREAVALMKNWRERMEAGGSRIDVEELKKALGLGAGLAQSQHMHVNSPEDRMKFFMETVEEFSEDDEGTDESNVHSVAEDVLTDESSVNLTEDLIQSRPQETSQDIKGNQYDSREARVEDVNFNAQKIAHSSGRPTSGVENRGDTRKQRDEIQTRNKSRSNGPVAKAGTPLAPIPKQVTIRNNKPRTTSVSSKGSKVPQKSRTRSKAEEEEVPAMTVGEKLKLAEEEARRVSLQSSSSPATQSEGSGDSIISNNPAQTARSPVRKSGMFGKPSRRRKSTLSPEELEDLMLGASP